MLNSYALRIREYPEQEITKRGDWVINWFDDTGAFGKAITYREKSTLYLEVAFQAAKNPTAYVISPEGYDKKPIKFIDLLFKHDAPFFARRCGRGRKAIIQPRENWDCMEIAAMDYFMRQRWQPSTKASEKLKKQTGIIASLNNTEDRKFGIDSHDFIGRNARGLLLHMIRTELQKDKLKPGAEEKFWLERQEELIALMNKIEDGSKEWVETEE